jgi:hypothetical protein
MFDSRRGFLKNLAGVSSSFLLFQSSPPLPKPRHRTPVDPPTAAGTQEEPSAGESATIRRAQLKAQEKGFRETMLQLFNRVTDLKIQLDAIHTSDVFSVTVLRQAQEIEKLAKRLKNYART